MKYLGVIIPKDLTDMYANYCPITKEIKTDFDKWAPLTLNRHNRIETIKFNI